jgi:hypothetical protein
MKLYAYLNVDDPWIAWLAYRGQMVSARTAADRVLSVWHAKYLFDACGAASRLAYFERELEIERVRAARFPHAVPRLSGLYFFGDVDTAQRAGRRWDGSFREEHLAEIAITQVAAVSKFDSEWITAEPASPGDGWIIDYLGSRPRGPWPLWEMLVEGRGVIVGTAVRQRAYETVKRAWPRSLGLLELSRVAVEIGSDLGLITPILTAADGVIDVRLYLNFRDAEDQAFLDRLGHFNGPKNTRDLNPGGDLVVPDLRQYVARFEVRTS